MTKKLTELFQLAPDDDSAYIPEGAQEVVTESLTTLEKIEAALPMVRGLESSDQELDVLADLAKTSFDDLMSLGMQVESRFSAEILGVASNMLGHAITAKTAKLNKKLKMIELQLKQTALQQKINNTVTEVESTPVGTARMLDRNELLRMLDTKRQQNDK